MSDRTAGSRRRTPVGHDVQPDRQAPVGAPAFRWASMGSSPFAAGTSGLPRTTPVAIIEVAGRRWVWAPWGDVHWVRNLRAAGSATITVRGQDEDVTATELDRTQRRRVLPRRPRSRGAGHAVRCPASSASSMGSISTIRSRRPRVDLSSSSTRCDHVKRVTLDVFEPGRARPSRTMVTRRRSRPRR